MLRLMHLEEIEGHLFKASGLINLLEKKDTGLVNKILYWLRSLERKLTSNRMSIASYVTSHRGILISANQGTITAGIIVHGKLTKRKIKEATCSHVLQSITEIVMNSIQKDIDRFSEAEGLMRQLIAVAKAKEAIQSKPDECDQTQYLKAIWKNLSSDPEMLAGTVRLEGLVGPHDALVILDRIMASDLMKQPSITGGP